LSGEAVKLYASEWIQNITDITKIAKEVCSLIDRQKIETALRKLPKEINYPICNDLKIKIGAV